MLPVLAISLLIVLQVVVVIRDSVALTSAARAGARRAMVDPSPAEVRAAAGAETHLRDDRLAVAIAGGAAPGDRVTVVVRYRAPTDVPFVGRFVGDIDLSERFVVLRE